MLEDLKAPAEVKNKDERVNLSEVEENFHVTQSFPVENLGKYLKTVVEEDGVRFESGLEVRDEGEMVGKLMVLSNLEDTEEILIDQNNYEVGTPIEVQINNHPDHDKEYLAETYYFSPDEMTPDEEGVAYRKKDFDRNVDMGESLT